jgi:hypothetical protein
LGKEKAGFSRVGHARLLKTKERARPLFAVEAIAGVGVHCCRPTESADPLRED